MPNIPYINYRELKEFYTIAEVCKLFQMNKQELRKRCEIQHVEPRRNEIGEYDFVKYDVRKLYMPDDLEEGLRWETRDSPFAASIIAEQEE